MGKMKAVERVAVEAAVEATADEVALPENETEAPGLILDPFCGQGTVLALANAWGFDALGLDTNRKRCKVTASRLPQALP